MKIDALRQFKLLQGALVREKEQLETRLTEINAVLGLSVSSPTAARATSAPAQGRPARRPHPGRGNNEFSLKEAVRRVTAKEALSKQAILDAVTKLGYKFTASNPMNSLNTLLYSGKSFKNMNGKFGPR